MATATHISVEYVNPFVQSVTDVFTKMLNASARMGKAGISDGAGQPRTIMAIVGFSGPIRGATALILPIPSALSIVSALLDEDLRVVDQALADGVSELVNIIAGGAKSRFPEADDKPLTLSIPTVVRGKDFHVESISKSVWLELPFDSEFGPFTLRVSLEQNTKPAGA